MMTATISMVAKFVSSICARGARWNTSQSVSLRRPRGSLCNRQQAGPTRPWRNKGDLLKHLKYMPPSFPRLQRRQLPDRLQRRQLPDQLWCAQLRILRGLVAPLTQPRLAHFCRRGTPRHGPGCRQIRGPKARRGKIKLAAWVLWCLMAGAARAEKMFAQCSELAVLDFPLHPLLGATGW